MIIIYGGTFNPPTIAHLSIAEYLIDKYQPKRFVFVPVGSYYNKANVASFSDRMNMLEIMIKNLNNSCVSDFENQMNQFKGTIATLDYFQNLYKNEKIAFVLGADNLLSFDNWVNVNELLNKYYFIVLNRNDLDIKDFIKTNNLLKNYQTKFIVEDDFPKMDLSATMYRNENRDDLVTKEVNEYIYKHGLYHRSVLNEK